MLRGSQTVAYRIRLLRDAKKQLDNITAKDYPAISGAIDGLLNEPRPFGVKKLKESNLWRLRVGSYRIVYQIDDRNSEVIIVRIARRSEDTYRNL